MDIETRITHAETAATVYATPAVAAAISESQEQNRIAHVTLDQIGHEGIAALDALCSGSVDECGDYWGEDSGGEWRIILDA